MVASVRSRRASSSFVTEPDPWLRPSLSVCLLSALCPRDIALATSLPGFIFAPFTSSRNASTASRICRLGTSSSTATPCVPQRTHVAPAAPPSSISACETALSETEAPQHGRSTALRKSFLVTGQRSSSGTSASSTLLDESFVAFTNCDSSATIRAMDPSGIWKPDILSPSSVSAVAMTSRRSRGIPTGMRLLLAASNFGSPLVGQN
mmetsp:Transcript_33180/g.82642  ORF Transcript_33180/g.82642 Transcript_33180/m.82642 type:complete len:207 (+) Transcript_33180:1890-2510(+)